MKLFCLSLFVLFTLNATASIYSSDALDSTDAVNSADYVPQEAYSFEFNIKSINLPPLKEDKLFRAIDLLSQVFSSPEFKEKILQHKFRKRFSFAHNKGLSNAEIYEQILNGAEKLLPDENNAMDVEVALYSDYHSTVLGFTRPNTKRIWMNTKYFNKHTPAEIAANLTHEWLHKLGFEHEEHWCPERKDSVPYAIGYIVQDIAEKLDEENSHQEGSTER